MLGAIVGDLAAWTYENDKERFFSSLTTREALLSPFGKTAYETAVWSLDRKEGELIHLCPEKHWGPLVHADNLIRCATLAWTTDLPFNLFESNYDIFYDDKEGRYAGRIIVELISGLHHGKAKKDVLLHGMGETFQSLKSGWEWKIIKPDQGLLIYLMRAWDCFEKAWDFTSAIHNAVRWENVDRHLLCCLTGALAEAMYGCEFNFLKKKYGGSSTIEYPEVLTKNIQRIVDYQFSSRFFFPKNSALTNVERQVWSGYSSKFEGMAINTEQLDRILRAFYTGWEARYGFYLDDGWIYTYRSHVLIARFRIKQNGASFSISDVQRSQEKPDCADTSIDDALCSSTGVQ